MSYISELLIFATVIFLQRLITKLCFWFIGLRNNNDISIVL